MSQAGATTTGYPDQRRHLSKYLGKLRTNIPESMKGFAQLHHAGSTDGALSAKTKELIALAVAVTSRCDGCIAFHVHDALKAGASDEEIAEALGVAVLMGGGPSAMYAAHVLQAVEEFRGESGA